ncbi:GNAT family N-acetyltransferase [Vibrio parahaemolyticus]|uniref:BioF2-like acetyltransferase domain-containing protein n=1 Tax=Vibrio parahaemolyticus TaxID=670 RepID=A0A7M1W8H0_VIBPH|nr:GNAT family N-acetyltransferase [Vibrio parahaemolyticus]EGQ7675716.1 GNAT family N-acetyltransferase [Vibrio parahaemolyticus]KYZ11422.1 hypothetical protein AW033_10945 [Vibrio parahaemolyticus]MBE3688743.1 GNAT family N-acetyltransferase [Vibrio parahaemolyticus]MBE3805620.1 GNAT family N-acetyltransferase [Vibrio parahaemolyticus]MBE4230420.1 GNAT family N-acetyltransferase [Vibrio parahaemolyticus]
MKICIVTDIKDIYSEWLSLYENSELKSPFIHPSWVMSIIEETLSPEDEVKIITVEKNKSLIAIFPLFVRNERKFNVNVKILSHLSSNLADYSHCLIHKDYNNCDIFKKVCRYIRDNINFDIGDIDNLSSYDIDSRKLKAYLTSDIFNLSSSTSRSLTPKLRLKNWESTVNKKIKQDTKRCEKRLKEKGGVEVVHTNQISNDELEKLLELKNIAYPGNAFQKAKNVNFLKRLLRDTNFCKYICFSKLVFDGDIIACHFGFRTEERFYYYMPVFDGAYRSYAVGNQLLLKLIEFSETEGIQDFDFLRGDESYKFSWTNDFFWNERIIFSGNNNFIYKIFSLKCSLQKAKECLS